MKTRMFVSAGLILGLMGFASGQEVIRREAKLLLEKQLLREKAVNKLVVDKNPAPQGEAAIKDVPGDAVNLVFLGDKKPVLLRLHVLVDGKSADTAWNAYIEKWFRYLDVANQGMLGADEVKLAPDSQQMLILMTQGGFFLGQRGINLGNLSLDKLGKAPGEKVSLAEFQAYYRQSVSAVTVQAQSGNSQLSAAAGNNLFKILDTNHDGKLTKEEILAAIKSVRKLDLDNDEWITLQELAPEYANNNNGGFGLQGLGGPAPRRANAHINDVFYQIYPGDRGLGSVLLDRYDREKIQRLTQKDLDLDAETFAKLDKNGDGSLDRDELNAWHERPADMQFVIRLGKNAGIELEKTRTVFEKSVTQTANVYHVNLGDSQINLGGAAIRDQGGMIRFAQPNFLQEQFRQADVKGNNFVELKDLEGQQFQFLRQNFTFMDRDRDGKLTRKEVDAFVELQSGGMDCFVTVNLADKGRALFQLLDANQDGRLSQRELLNAWSRMEALDKDKRGYIVPTDLIRQFQINAQRGLNNGLGGFQVIVDGGLGMGRPPVPVQRYPAGTPDWFRKMDKNGDGDVSPAEFLGTRAEFDRIDADHDGLISPEEAIQYDALKRKAN